jgi:hypothetical protein
MTPGFVRMCIALAVAVYANISWLLVRFCPDWVDVLVVGAWCCFVVVAVSAAIKVSPRLIDRAAGEAPTGRHLRAVPEPNPFDEHTRMWADEIAGTSYTNRGGDVEGRDTAGDASRNHGTGSAASDTAVTGDGADSQDVGRSLPESPPHTEGGVGRPAPIGTPTFSTSTLPVPPPKDRLSDEPPTYFSHELVGEVLQDLPSGNARLSDPDGEEIPDLRPALGRGPNLKGGAA